LNELNTNILMHLWFGGLIPSYTTLDGKYTLRVCITNHRSRKTDFDHLVEEVVRIAQTLK